MIGDIILTDPDENGKQDRWTQVPPSEVGKRFEEDSTPPDDPDAICLICKAPAVARAMFMFQVDGSKEEGNERIRSEWRWPTTAVDENGESYQEETDENHELSKSERIAVMAVCRRHRGQWILEELQRGYLWPQWSQN